MQKAPFSIFGILLRSLLAILFLPLYFVGGVINYLPYKLPVWLTKKIKDPQFISSVRNVIAIIIFPIYYILLIIAGSFIDQAWWLKLSILVLLPFAGLFAFNYYIEVKKLYARIRFTFKTWFKNKDLQDLKENYNFICNKMDTIT